jgi:hypothetical protein
MRIFRLLTRYCTLLSSLVSTLACRSVGSVPSDVVGTNLLGIAFLLYSVMVIIIAVILIYKVAPKYGKKNPLVYLTICSSVGSISIMAIKAFGIALKLTLGGSNQFTHPSTYVFLIITGVCILTQMNYFNKALSQFPTNM